MKQRKSSDTDESLLSDYLQSHSVPLPDFSHDSANDEGNSFQEISSLKVYSKFCLLNFRNTIDQIKRNRQHLGGKLDFQEEKTKN